MRKTLVGIGVALLLGSAVVYAQAPGYWGRSEQGQSWGPGMMGHGWGQGMGPGMMQGYYGPYGGPDYSPGEAITLDQAKEIAKQYGDKFLKGFTVERVLPFTGMRQTMYSVEMKGPKGEVQYLHINPWGGVMPFTSAARAG